MLLKDFLLQKKSVILKKWFERILETYPQETQRFLQRQKDPFANPVWSTILKGIEGLYEELLQGNDFARVSFFLDNITRVRAVQDFPPSAAIAFIPFLKKILRDELPSGDPAREDDFFEDLLEFESRIDQLTLLAFDIYVACREKLYEIRINEIKNRSARVLERLSSAHEKRQPEPDPGEEETDRMNQMERGKRT
jgi:hypothetical protein